MARARSTEIATSVLMEAETLTPCRYDMALHTKRPSTQAVKEEKEGQLYHETRCYLSIKVKWANSTDKLYVASPVGYIPRGLKSKSLDSTGKANMMT